MVSRRPFSGYWEYHIDGALFTAPARTDHSGAGLFNADGELVGIGSLVVGRRRRADGTAAMRGNMFVPVDLLKPILAEMRDARHVAAAARAPGSASTASSTAARCASSASRRTARPRRPACGRAT